MKGQTITEMVVMAGGWAAGQALGTGQEEQAIPTHTSRAWFKLPRWWHLSPMPAGRGTAGLELLKLMVAAWGAGRFQEGVAYGGDLFFLMHGPSAWMVMMMRRRRSRRGRRFIMVWRRRRNGHSL